MLPFQPPGLRLGVAVQSSHPKAVPPATILDAALAAAAAEGAGELRADGAGGGAASVEEQVAWCAAESMVEALALAAAPLQEQPGAVVLCCGSVFVAADMRAALAREEPALFAQADWVFEESGEPPLLM